MAANASPLAFEDLFGVFHVEPSVTGLIETQANETPRSINPNDMIVASPFRSGKPKTLYRSRTLSRVQDIHDPDRNADQGVALARMTRDPFADDNVFGSGDLVTVRVNAATQGIAYITASATNLIKVTTGDYGLHVNGAVGGSRVKVLAGTNTGKKIQLFDSVRSFVGDDLGSLMTLEYTGDGSAATVTFRRAAGTITYTGQPTDADIITVNGVDFEFESAGGVAPGNVSVAIGVDEDTTFASLATAINANVPGVTATAVAATNTVTLSAPEQGVLLVETLDSGAKFAVAHSGQSVYLYTELTGATDGSQPLNIPLTLSAYKTLQNLVNFINTQQGYEAAILSTANGFLTSTSIDPVTASDITTALTLTGYVAALADFINSKTKGNYAAEVLVYGTEPDEALSTDAPTNFTGGSTSVVTATDWEQTLDAIAAEQELGGVVLLDTDDEAIFAAATTWVSEQRTLGKWFRLYLGANPNTALSGSARTNKFLAISGALDSSRVRLVCQRVGVFDSGGAITYLHPVYLAAALAGGAAGNRPYVKPLTNKRLRVAGIHDDDNFTVETRETLLQGGVTVIKKEQDRVVVTLAVTSSHDPDRRMERLISERDTVDLVDANVRAAFLPLRGKWASLSIAATVNGLLSRVLNTFASPTEGALSEGADEAGNRIPAWEWVPAGPNGEPWVLQAGVLKLSYRIFIGGELNHISLHGYAEYARIVGTLAGSPVELSTSVPIS